MVENLGVIANTISLIGFPVICCIGMAWYIRDSSIRNAKTYKEYNKRYEDLAKSCIDIVQENSAVTAELTTLLKHHLTIDEMEVKTNGEINHNYSQRGYSGQMGNWNKP